MALEAERGGSLFLLDIPLLAARLTASVSWLCAGDETSLLPVGIFGASTGAAAALITAAERPSQIAAVVSRGGRPDLAGAVLHRVRAPTLLIVGGQDTEVIALNRSAAMRLACEHQLAIVPEATHLFEEPGTLEVVSKLASAWFVKYLGLATAGT